MMPMLVLIAQDIIELLFEWGPLQKDLIMIQVGKLEKGWIFFLYFCVVGGAV